jgi:hypothetical protein
MGLTTKNIGILISKITLETLGVDVSPHLFRTAAASTAAAYGGNTPYLASALAEPHRSARDRGALQSCEHGKCGRGLRTDNFRISHSLILVTWP